MKTRQARQLVAVLAFKRIPFSWRREGSTHIVSFPEEKTITIAQAIGDLGPDLPRKRSKRKSLVTSGTNL